MKTRTTRLTLSHSEGAFEVEIVDEGVGEYVMVSCGTDNPPFGQHISINPDEWPFLRDAIDQMFVEIAKNESEGKLKELPETLAPWDEEPYDPPSWIPWSGGESAPAEAEFKYVAVRLRDGSSPVRAKVGWWWDWFHLNKPSDIIAYKVVD